MTKQVAQRDSLYKKVLKNEKSMQNSIFVVGSPRSGTGMISKLIGAAEDTRFLGETGLFPLVFFGYAPFVWLKKYCKSLPAPGISTKTFWETQRIRLTSKLRGINRLDEFSRRAVLYTKFKPETIPLGPTNPLYQVMGIELEAKEEELARKLREKWGNLLRRSPEHFVPIAFEDLRILSDTKVIIEKTPPHVDYIAPILQMFPRARIVFTKRENDRAVLASYLQMTKKYRSVRALAHRFKEIEKIRKTVETNYPDQIYSIQYENITVDPTNEIKKLYRWLQLEWPSRLDSVGESILPKKDKYETLNVKDRQFIDDLL